MKKIKLITVALALTTSLLVLGGCGSSTPAAGDKTTGEVKVFQGVGQTSNFRDTGRKTDSGVLKYNINYVTAAALFDNEGKIIDVQFDVLEISNQTKLKKALLFSQDGLLNQVTLVQPLILLKLQLKKLPIGRQSVNVVMKPMA